MISEQNQRRLAAVLTAVGWFWTAYECDTIGIDVFDMLLKRFPGQLWIMAAVLTYLTIIWMPKNLLTRSIMGIFMLIPAERESNKPQHLRIRRIRDDPHGRSRADVRSNQDCERLRQGH